LADEFMILRPFYDITYTGTMTANQTLDFTAEGLLGTTNYMTPNTVTTSALGGSYFAEITDIEIYPPRDSAGNYEDLREIWFTVDGTSTRHYLSISGYGLSLMFPPHQRVVGGRHLAIRLGEPLWRLCMDVINGRSDGTNMPILATGLKYKNRISVSVRTVNGVTGAGTGGWRVVLKGYRYTADQLAYLAAGWRNTINVQTLRRIVTNKQPLQTTFVPGGSLSPDTWTTFPGGTTQTTIKVNPYIHFAYNAVATQPTAPFNLSNEAQVSGASGNVETPFWDLGLPFAGSNNAFILKATGIVSLVRPSNLARFGWWLNGDYVPELLGGIGNGIPVTDAVNDYAFGDSGPYSGDLGTGTGLSGQYLPIPRVPGELLVYKDNFAPFIGANGSAIPANGVCLAMVGTLVEQS
jgi:hypothetical protein